MIGAAKGYRVIILVDPKTTNTNLALLRAFGAEVVVVTEQDDSGSYHKTRIALANKLAREIENSFRPDQCFNLMNSDAHYNGTACEIIAGCPSGLTAFIAAVSTGGQLGGISKYLKTYMPEVQVVGVDAVGSSIFGGDSHSYRIPGIGLAWTPNNLTMDNIDCVYKITDEQAFVTARSFARFEGILMGPSSGACALVALHLVQRFSQYERVVCMVSDGGERYIHTLFNDEWMLEQGFSTDVNIESLRNSAVSLQPWSTNPLSIANYKPELNQSLEVPVSTMCLNMEMLQEGHFGGEKHMRFLD
jgi:cystathionine beta-synthase/cysteine synthase A